MKGSIYDETEEEADGDLPNRKQAKKSHVNVYDPMFAWIMLLLLAVALKVILENTAAIPVGTILYSILIKYSDFMLNFPGTVILPLLVGVIIGEEVGIRSSSMKNAMRSGLLNGIYASVIYIVVTIILFLVVNYFTPQFISAYSIVLSNIAIPIAALLIALETFAVLSYSRKVDQ
ncbi:MAG: hypothetical protein ACYCO0_03845 [Candidatus Micrarchaeaceae archaeon]